MLKKICLVILFVQSVFASFMEDALYNLYQSASEMVIENPKLSAAVSVCAGVGILAKHCYKRFKLNQQLLKCLSNDVLATQITAQAQEVKKLIDSKADPNVKWFGGTTYLQHYCSVSYSPIQLVKVLIDNGADLHRRDYDFLWKSNGATPLISACKFRKPEIVRLLLEKLDADAINARDCNGRTALMWAMIHETTPGAYRGIKSETVKLLLDYKAKANIKDKAGITALNHLINSYCFNEQEECFSVLFDLAGKDILDQDIDDALIKLNTELKKYEGLNAEASLSIINRNLNYVEMQYAKRIFSAINGLSVEEHERVIEKLTDQEIDEIIQYHNLMPNDINYLIAQYIAVDPNEIIKVQESDANSSESSGDEVFGDFGQATQRVAANQVDNGVGLGLI